jgi:hypothetical protein
LDFSAAANSVQEMCHTVAVDRLRNRPCLFEGFFKRLFSRRKAIPTVPGNDAHPQDMPPPDGTTFEEHSGAVIA